MNDEDSKRVPTEFGPEEGFEIRPARGTVGRSAPPPGGEAEFRGLSEHLLRERLTLDPRQEKLVNRAARLAGALARATGYPLLVFPVLFEEQVVLELAREEDFDRTRQLKAAALIVGLVLWLVMGNLLAPSSELKLAATPTDHSQTRVVLAPAIPQSPAPAPPSSF